MARSTEHRTSRASASTFVAGRGASVDGAARRVRSRGGHRSVRSARLGARTGTHYYELELESLGETGCVRVGVSTDLGNVEASVGADASSYAFVSRTGDKVHDRARTAYSEAVATQSDVIGVLLHFPTPIKKSERSSLGALSRAWMRFSGRRETSFIEFFLNGRSLGRAFEHVAPGLYRPCVSVFTHSLQSSSAIVRFNFGPIFRSPPQTTIRYEPFSSGL